MNNCIFCTIAKRDSSQYQSQVVYEDNIFIAMLVSHPQTAGHTIVFTKKHFSELKNMNSVIGNLMLTVVKVSEKLIRTLKAKAYTLKINNNLYKLEDNPLHVGHIHIHIIPRYTPDDKIDSNPKQVDINILRKLKDKIADKIKA
ncbi:MAG: HIT family protein [Patescibacteria group bacterium]